MKKVFVKTKNVKRFITLMEELQKLPPNIPKLALVYGEHGLGKSNAIQWWTDKNDLEEILFLTQNYLEK